MSKAVYNQETRDWYNKLLAGKTIEEKIYSLELAERQKYHYYCDCSDRWTTEQNREYESQWNEIITMLNELKAHQTSKVIIRDLPQNHLEEIENLIDQGYTEEHAEEVAALNNYDIPLEEIFDYN